jgi:hypothetical protein
MDAERQRTRFRSFALGSLVGASAALAAARRRRPRSPDNREAPAGLKAFEGAPCYEELVDAERYAAARETT